MGFADSRVAATFTGFGPVTLNFPDGVGEILTAGWRSSAASVQALHLSNLSIQLHGLELRFDNTALRRALVALRYVCYKSTEILASTPVRSIDDSKE
jgi:hypothetical protein